MNAMHRNSETALIKFQASLPAGPAERPGKIGINSAIGFTFSNAA
ncbi:MAG: hypothetical protein JWQ49_3805 [Edaphobacter sp.]|nr:hypothetical protein [Edaphobacter sp.]